MDSLPPEKVEEVYKKIGDNVKKIRTNKKVSQLKLSIAMGYSSVSVVSCAELYLNKIHFNIEHLVKIAHILEVDFLDLFEGVDV